MRRARIGVAVVGALSTLASAGSAGAAPAYGAYQRPALNTLVTVTPDGGPSSGDAYVASMSDDGSLVAFSSGAWGLVDEEVLDHGDVYVRDVERGRTRLVSRGHDGAPSDGGSLQPFISADGLTVVFVSYATNLVPDDPSDGRWAQVYAHDLRTGRTELVSRSLDGTATDGGALQPRVSADGRLVTWHSSATNLVAGDTNGRSDVFLHDRATGETRLVSVSADGQQGDGSSTTPRISADGSTVVFTTSATNLVPGDTNGVRDVVAVDLATGAVELVSVATDGTAGNYDSTFSDVSADGQVIAFQSGASNLVPVDTNGTTRAIDGFDVFVRDRTAGVTERVSVTSTGMELRSAHAPDVSADGRFVAFASIKPGEDASSFTAWDDVYVHDRATHATELLSATPSGAPATGNSDNPVLSADGSVAAFQSSAPDLVPGDGNEAMDIVRRERGRDLDVLDVATTGFGGRDVTVRYAVAGVALLSAVDEPEPATTPLGADLRAASVTYRPEDGDLLLRLQLDRIPRLSPPPGVPGVVSTGGLSQVTTPGLIYGLTFTLDGVRYELRTSRVGEVAAAPLGAANVANPSPPVALYRCTTSCARVASPDGGVGTTGEEARLDLPLAPLGLEPGEELRDLRAVVALGDGVTGFAGVLDELVLGDLTLPGIDLTLTVGSHATSVAPSRGIFSERFTTAPPAGTAISARVCFVDRCADRSRTAG